MNVIATVSASFTNEKILKIIQHPLISGFRWNTGPECHETPYDLLNYLKNIASQNSKQFWVDLKCRQLRVNEWCYPEFTGAVILNLPVKIELPAKIFFRGEGWFDIKAVDGEKIFLSSFPKYALGKGQSVNILAKNIKVEEYFTQNDLDYIKAAKELGIKHFMLSFYEGPEDIEMFRQEFGSDDFVLALKIESEKGMAALIDFNSSPKLQLVVARDDLMTNLGGAGKSELIFRYTADCLSADKNAIVASQFLLGLEQAGKISSAEVSDICLMDTLGCKSIMLSDTICLRHFDEAIEVLGRILRELK